MSVCLFLGESSIYSQDSSAINFKAHEVTKGETSYGIAKKYQINLNDFFKANPQAANGLSKGEIVKIPIPIFSNNDSIVKFTAFGLQMSVNKNLLTSNICLFYDEDYQEDIKEEWYVALDTILVLNPQVVKNHFTKEEMVLTQDYNNKLFALNTSGETLWSIQVNGKILGEINYIDAFKNRKYQALFNTATHLYLVDRNGENVEGFPKELPSTTKLGHSLFDYSNNRNYRICIVGEDNIIFISQDEMYQMNSNIFSISPEVIISEKGFNRLNNELRKRGFTVEEVPYAEISKMEGLLRCSTLPLQRV